MYKSYSTNSKSSPISLQEFSQMLNPLIEKKSCSGIAVAVSGGADSMALALLTQKWAKRNQVSLKVLGVDHGLREGSSKEMEQVSEWMEARGIPFESTKLEWEKIPRKGKLQRIARDRRYHELGMICKENDISHLLTAHHMGDLIETFFMRLIRESGIDGLAGIPTRWRRDSCLLVRPLLEVPKDRLIATCEAEGQEWLEDPTNADPAFVRNYLRQVLQEKIYPEIPQEEFLTIIKDFGEVREEYEALADQLIADYVKFNRQFGYAIFPAQILHRFHPSLLKRFLLRLIRCMTNEVVLANPGLNTLYEGLLVAKEKSPVTWSRCSFEIKRGDVFVSVDKAQHFPRTKLPMGETILWDGRFEVTLNPSVTTHPSDSTLKREWIVRNVTAHDWTTIVKQSLQERYSKFRYVPRMATRAIPLVETVGGTVVAIPSLDLNFDSTVRVSCKWVNEVLQAEKDYLQ